MDPESTLLQTPEEKFEAGRLSEPCPDIKGYRAIKRLGGGSFGSVYQAEQLRTGQVVALKVLHQDTQSTAYFRQELVKLIQVAEHPHVVSLLDADLNHSPPYIVMPHLSGGSLDRADIKVEKVAQWAREMAEALQFMHGKGLLHCDLKPSNVLLDDAGRIRLVDFGQARRLGEFTGAYGTLGYMPPEQANLESHPDVLWDVYGWGATIYRLLSDQCPRFSSNDRTEVSRSSEVSEQLEMYRTRILQRPLKALTEMNPAVDADLAQIVEACLALDPERRPPSFQSILEDFERRKNRDPLLCLRPWSTRYRVVRFFSKPALAIALLVAIMVPLFVNTYLTVRAHLALRKQLFEEVKVVNHLTAEQLRDQISGPPPILVAGQGYLHYLLDSKNRVVAGSQAGGSFDFKGVEKQVNQPEGGYFHRDRLLYVAAWCKLGPYTLVSEKPALPSLNEANELLTKNLLLNGLILTSAASMAVVLVRLTRN